MSDGQLTAINHEPDGLDPQAHDDALGYVLRRQGLSDDARTEVAQALGLLGYEAAKYRKEHHGRSPRRRVWVEGTARPFGEMT